MSRLIRIYTVCKISVLVFRSERVKRNKQSWQRIYIKQKRLINHAFERKFDQNRITLKTFVMAFKDFITSVKCIATLNVKRGSKYFKMFNLLFFQQRQLLFSNMINIIFIKEAIYTSIEANSVEFFIYFRFFRNKSNVYAPPLVFLLTVSRRFDNRLSVLPLCLITD